MNENDPGFNFSRDNLLEHIFYNRIKSKGLIDNLFILKTIAYIDKTVYYRYIQ
jgi:hypothetical protein